jgi:hypothetical protein
MLAFFACTHWAYSIRYRRTKFKLNAKSERQSLLSHLRQAIPSHP